MRIIGGKYRGRNLKSPPSLEVRPTSDRLRETLFNVLAPRIEGSRFLDLCAGSGAVGIEALSRGARHATFVDRSRKMFALIEANLKLCGIAKEESQTVNSEATEFLRGTKRRGRRQLEQNASEDRQQWNIVFYDPPYAADYFPVLELFGLQASDLLAEDGLLVVEHHHKKALPDEFGSLCRTRVLKQGDASLSFYVVQTSVKDSGGSAA